MEHVGELEPPLQESRGEGAWTREGEGEGGRERGREGRRVNKGSLETTMEYLSSCEN